MLNLYSALTRLRYAADYPVSGSAFRCLTVAVFLLLAAAWLPAQSVTDTLKKVEPSKKWYETISIRGYVQARYNRLLETNPDLKCEQCDRSWGRNGGFSLRRARVIIYGQIHKQVYFYIQPDFASSASSTGLNFGQLRDAYFDIGVDKKNEFRFRIGQSKVPYGFENMQSSQNRLPLDRNDALNSAVPNERDLGIFFYWTPEKTRERFSALVKDGLKGSGNYGVFALGLYNGQTANKPELNDEPYVVARLTYPFAVGNQILETSLQAYTGKYTLGKDQLSAGVQMEASHTNNTFTDQRIAVSAVLYPKPFGIQAEYNIGKGPEYNPVTKAVEIRNLNGGYVLLSWMTKINNQVLIPFTRYQYYRGGKKHELDARSHRVNELELGVEWQPLHQFELTCMYTISNRRFEDYQLQTNLQKGNLLRVQAQVNF